MILLSAIALAGIFATVVFTACNKTTCSNILCRNGGSCSDAKCTCPTGFTGSLCESMITGTLVYQNNTFTPITIAVNGTSAIIAPGGTASFTGQYNAPATGTASTSGASSTFGVTTAGGILGLTIAWDINNTFPSGDSQRVPLDVGATYFFLRLANKTPRNIIDYYVNINFSYGSYYLDATIPNDGKTYDMGYYLAYSTSNVQTQSTSSSIFYSAVSLPFTSNQSATINITN